MNIIELAKQAGFPERRAFSDLSDLYPRLERFAALVRAETLEEAALMANFVAREIDDTNGIATYITAAIRALIKEKT